MGPFTFNDFCILYKTFSRNAETEQRISRLLSLFQVSAFAENAVIYFSGNAPNLIRFLIFYIISVTKPDAKLILVNLVLFTLNLAEEKNLKLFVNSGYLRQILQLRI